MKRATGIGVSVCLVMSGLLTCGDDEEEPRLEIRTISFNGTLYVYPQDCISGENTMWGLIRTATGATSATNGAANTATAVSAQGSLGTDYATLICAELVSHGFDDWYLPARDELNALYQNRAAIGTLSSQWYWSSTEEDLDDAWLQNFANGFSHAASKGLLARVRCVRRN